MQQKVSGDRQFARHTTSYGTRRPVLWVAIKLLHIPGEKCLPKNPPNDRKTHNVIRQGQAVSRRRGNPATTLSALMAVSATASGWRLSVRPSISLSGRYF